MRRLFTFDDDGLPQQSFCMEKLAGRAELLCGVLMQSWYQWMSLDSEQRMVQNGASRGLWIYNLTVAHAKERMKGFSGIGWNEQPFFVVTFDNLICIRFRKLSSGYVANHDKPLSKLYYQHKPICGLDSSLKRLTCGFVLDRSEQDVVDIAITCQENDRVVWRTSILSEVDSFPVQDVPDLPDIGLPTPTSFSKEA